jgi:hypothetical protein
LAARLAEVFYYALDTGWGCGLRIVGPFQSYGCFYVLSLQDFFLAALSFCIFKAIKSRHQRYSHLKPMEKLLIHRTILLEYRAPL